MKTGKLRIAVLAVLGLVLGLVAARIQKGGETPAQALVSANDFERNNALRSLETMKAERRDGAVAELLEKYVASPEPRERLFALYALRKTRIVTPPLVDAFVSGLSDKDTAVRREAEVGVREIGEPAIPVLIRKMDEPSVRATAAQVMKLAQPDVLVPIKEALDRPDPKARRAAAFLLSHATQPETVAAAKSLAPDLAAGLDSDDRALAADFAFALRALDPADPRPTDVFLWLIRQDDWDAPDVRGWEALDALVARPEDHERVAAELLALLPSAPDRLDKAALSKKAAIGAALEKVAPRKRNTAALSADLRSHNAAIRWRAAYVTSAASTVDVELMTPLVQALDDPDLSTAARAFVALATMGLNKTDRAASTIHPKLRATAARVGDKIPGFQEISGPALAQLASRE